MKTFFIELDDDCGILGWNYITYQYGYDNSNDIKLISAKILDNEGKHFDIINFLDDEKKEEICRLIKNSDPEPSEDSIKNLI